MSITIKCHSDFTLFLTEAGYEVEELDGGVYVIRHEIAVAEVGGKTESVKSTIIAAESDGELSFAMDLVSVSDVAEGKRTGFFERMLDLNTEINPIAFAIDSTGEKARVVLVDSIATSDLDASELLHTLDQFESAAITAYEVLGDYVNDEAA